VIPFSSPSHVRSPGPLLPFLLAFVLAMLAAPAAANTGFTGVFTIDLRAGPLPIAGLTFTAPAWGATLETGLSSTVSWSYSGATPNAEAYLALVEPGGAATHPVAKTALGAGSFDGWVAGQAGNGYRFRMTTIDGFSSDGPSFSLSDDPPTEGATFRALASPCRAVDTRAPGGYPISGGRMGEGESRSFVIPSSSCGIPPDASAYSLNATVVPAGPLGYLTMWPTGQARPLVSTLNSSDGRVKANAAIVPAGAGGAISAYVTDSTDLILDVNGYFVPAGSSGGLSFYPVTPCRIGDTRNAPGPNGGPTMQAGEPRTISPSGVCGIPSMAQALSLNYTVVPREALGFLTTWPTGQDQPFVSTLNAPTGTIVANAAIVPTGAGGQVSIYVTNATDVIVDVNGYFAPAGSPGALSFYASTPCRIVDTRLADGPFGGPVMAPGETRGYTVPSSSCSIPSTARAYSLSATVVPNGGLGYLSLWPTVSILDAPDGAVTSNAAIVPAGAGGTIDVFTTDQTHLLLDVNGYFAPARSSSLEVTVTLAGGVPLTMVRIAAGRFEMGL